MPEQQSRLAIIIDSTGAEKNADSLTTALGKMTGAGERAAAAAGKVTKATDQEKQALSELLDRIDPVNAALNRLDKQQQDLARYKSKGMIDADTFAVYSKQIEDTRNKLTGFNEQLSRTGMTAKQTAANMRMVPAQMTDIVVSLASGQAPLTVLLQQGGQLKDMFGGIVPAAKALGTYVTGLINPFTLAAAAVGTLGLAYYKGSQEQDEFYKSLTLNGNLAGKTADQLADIAARVSVATNSTTGMAASTLNLLVSSGKVASDSLERVTSSIVETGKATGIATDKLVDDFNSIASNPVAAISKLNDQYHFLTLATYSQIKALQDEGNQQEASRIATEAYATTMQQRARDIRENLGALERAWNSVTGAAKSAWDAMLDVGRPQTDSDKLATLNGSIEEAQKMQAEGGLWNRFKANSNGYNLPDMIKRRDALQSQITTEGVLNEAISKYNESEQKRISLRQQAEREGEKLTTAAEKRAKALAQEKKYLDAGVISLSDYEKRTSRINEIFKDPAKPKGRAYTEDAGTRMLDNLRQQQQVLLDQSRSTDKLGTQQQALIKWEQQLADIKNKQTLTADQKSLLANSEMITAQLQQNAAIEKQISNRERLLSIERARADIERTIANRANQYGAEEFMASGGMSQYEQQQYQQRLSLEQSYNDKITQLRQNRAMAMSEAARQQIDEEIRLQQEGLATELRNYDEHIQRMNEARGSFSAGASRAWREYLDSASNVSAMSQQLFSSAFSGMEDAIVKFATTGKASFKDFATSVISDLARIAARQAIAGIGSSIFGSVLSAGVSAATGSVGSTPSGAYNNAAAGLKFNAKGGVYDSPSLSSYSNGVYDKPQFFAFAKGAGVFGEAGPEAIMPLARSSDGSLGVRMLSGGNGAGANITVNAPVTIVQEGGSNSGEANNTSTANTAQQLSGIVQTVITDRLKKEISPGGMLYRPA
ncbi:phage tail tape measure protein [Siccibacter colletis]|uniref:phage tail tape measure protein n=1 Tax=Siccibacter colletis TaxID=1505757 RepID=UPI00068AFC6D|nr:phage tail tape measure protein [Siccibacter colletis]